MFGFVKKRIPDPIIYSIPRYFGLPMAPPRYKISKNGERFHQDHLIPRKKYKSMIFKDERVIPEKYRDYILRHKWPHWEKLSTGTNGVYIMYDKTFKKWLERITTNCTCL